jgi:cytochrome c oxidase cbb3-type subunit 2
MSDKNKKESLQSILEKNIFALVLGLSLALSLAGIVEIVPLFTIDSTFEDKRKDANGDLLFPNLTWHRKEGQTLSDWKAGDGVRPYKALELAGRDVYQKEGCYLCHSQMIRPFRDEKERYGHYSLAVESKYDHPMQWGSKRTGPDLARVGGKYSDEWHLLHLKHPQAVVPESVMPKYFFLAKRKVDSVGIQKRMKVMRMLGVPYTDKDIALAPNELIGKTDMDAMIAYLQVLGTMVKFEKGVDYRE